MISSVRGVVQAIGDEQLVLELGGVGLTLHVPHSVLEHSPGVGRTMFLHTYLAVREDALNLYGFSSQDQRELFTELIQVSGIGPRLALAVLSTLSLDSLRMAVGNNQPEALERVPGIGKKTAEKMVFQLKDRIAFAPPAAGPPGELDDEVLSVLTALGYSMLEAQSAVRSLDSNGDESVEERVRQALRYFAKP